MKPVIFFIAVLLICSHAWALDDTPENRAAQAERYLSGTVQEVFDGLVEQVSRTIAPGRRQEFKDKAKIYIDIGTLSKTMKEALIKHFSADELQALADFYGSPVGKSAMKKYPVYFADFIQTEMPKVIAKIKQDMNESKNRQ